MKKKYVTYENFKNYIKILDKKINDLDWNPEIILSINRGGCTPGVYLSHIKGIKHHVINISDNVNADKFRHQRLLIADCKISFRLKIFFIIDFDYLVIIYCIRFFY